MRFLMNFNFLLDSVLQNEKPVVSGEDGLKALKVAQ